MEKENWIVPISSFNGIRHMVKIEPTPEGLQVYDRLILWSELVKKLENTVGLEYILDEIRKVQDGQN